jgi:endonuclease/exonuclease/phosphatase family metal-dependent hydrolase
MKIRYYFLLLVLLPWVSGIAQSAKSNPKATKKTFVAMFYNVENLFDTADDPKVNDDEFTPAGKVPWTEERLNTKIKQIGQVMNDIASPAMPDLVGFAEVENTLVLEMLTSSDLLSKNKYNIVHYDSPDERGIDVAMIYNASTFKLISSEPLEVILPGNDLTRDILYIKGKVNSGEILHVFINHWPSRREGTELSEPNRMAAANVLRAKIDAIQKLEKSANILVLGDFNDEPSDKTITVGLKSKSPEMTVKSADLCSMLYPEYKKGEGSLFYKDWDLFDQIIVSGNTLTRKKGLRTSVDHAEIFRAEYLLFKTKEGESRPNRTMSSSKYFGGYSDHLPVYVIFNLN